ncbi:MAG: amidase [Acidimicrobiaceae bacterium]|nr:amidase [Acidimicrobiaceae bacterium]
MNSDLVRLSATEQRRLISSTEVSPSELLEAHIETIEAENPTINAICIPMFEAARASAKIQDNLVRSGLSETMPLLGVVVGVKDTHDIEGVRTTFGSPLMTNHLAVQTSLHVQRMIDAGALVVGKTNTPEWAAGSHTFNPVFGTTFNPFDRTRTVGGSSGGAAAALATNMVALADGSDMGGSLRNPASFCGVFGLRPSIGSVPELEHGLSMVELATAGPMARTAADLSLLFSVIAGFDPRDPLSFDLPSTNASLKTRRKGAMDSSPTSPLRIGVSADLGVAPLDDVVRSGFADRIRLLREAEQLDGTVELIDIALELTEAETVFRTIRAMSFANTFGDLINKHPKEIKAEIIQNTEEGLALSAKQILNALDLRERLIQKLNRTFFEFDYLLTPTVGVLPFPAEIRFPTEVGGKQMSDYIGWMATCTAISATASPAISLPAGFIDGLPFGLQLVGPPKSDLKLIDVAGKLSAVFG